MIKLIITLTLLIQIATANSCWNIDDDKEFAFKELDSKIVLSFRDAVDCSALTNVNVNIFNQEFITNNKGEVSLPIPPKDLNFAVSLEAKEDGYMRLEQKVDVAIGTFSNVKFLLTKQIPLSSARVVLSWNENPTDLDLHIKSDDFHISYRNKNVPKYIAKLDQDSTSGFGPETITINKLNKDKRYDIFVYNYSQNGKLDNKTNITIYANGKLDNSIQLKPTYARCIKVATIYNNIVEYRQDEVNNSNCQ